MRKGDGSAKVWLEPKLKVNYFSNYKSSEQREIWEIVERNYDYLLKQGNEFFSKHI